MIKKHPLKIFNVLSYQEREIKSTLRFHPTSNRMAKTMKTTNNKYWQGYREMGTFINCLCDCKLVWPPWKSEKKFLKKLLSQLYMCWHVPKGLDNPLQKYLLSHFYCCSLHDYWEMEAA